MTAHPLGRHGLAPQVAAPEAGAPQVAAPTPPREKRRRSPLLGCLLLVLFPVLLPVLPLIVLVVRIMPFVRWVERNLDDPGPHSVWGKPKPDEIKKVLEKHGCYYLHGPLGSGKTMGALMLGLVMAWSHVEQLVKAGDHETPVYLFANFTVHEYRALLFLVLLGAPTAVVNRVRIEQFSIMDQTEATKTHVWRRRHSVIVADEIPYYMEDDKKTVRGMILKHFRMVRRRQQTLLAVGQELIHSRYRPLFHLRGQCGMAFGRMRIVWRGAQDPVDNKKPTKPQATTAYGLDVRRLAKCYDTWEDLEDLDDDETPETSRPLRRVS